jgi:tetratricopeptide (TPR) repeat protein
MKQINRIPEGDESHPFREMALANRITIIAVSIIAISSLLFNCGGAAKKDFAVASTDTTIDKNVIVTQHRAFDHFTKGDLYEKSGDLEKAADEYRLALFYDPSSDEIKRSLAMALYDLARYSEALEVAVQITEQSVNDRLLIAGCYHGMGDLNKTIEYYEAIAEADSAPQGVIEDLVEYYVFQGNQKKVEKYYQWLIENGDNAQYWRSDLASAYIKLDKPKKAEAIFQGMIETDSLDWGAYLGLAGVEMYKADTLAADSLYRYVVYGNWDSGPMLSILLPALLDIYDDEMSVKVARRITELFPQDYLAMRRYGILLFTTGDYVGADSVFVSIIEAVNDDPISFYYRGRIAQQNRDYVAAETLSR